MKYLRRYIRYVWIPLALLCICIGAAHPNLDDTAAVTGISVDIDKHNEQFIFGFEIAAPKGDTDVEGEVCKVSAPDLETALTAAAGVYPRPLACISTDLILISKEVAKHHISDICRMILRDWSGDPRAELAVVQEDTAFAALSKDVSQDIRAVSLSEQLRLARKKRIIDTKDALSFATARLQSADLALPMIRAESKGYTIVGYYEEKSV